MHKPEPIMENEMDKVLLDSEIQPDNRISPRRPDLVIINNNKKEPDRIEDFIVPADHRVKIKERK